MTESESSPAEVAVLRAGDQIGPYTILSILGQGGMGAVFLARHETLEREVAIKVLRPDVQPSGSSIERFVREAKAAAAIRHPHVVDVYDVGAQQGALYMVMERLHGKSLADVIEEKQKLSVEETLDVVLPILDALDVVHDEGIVHRDIKPDNIFVVRGKRRSIPKLLDFGISKVRTPGESAQLTGASALMGTPAYMAPEQVLEAREVDRRADLYSLCAVIFECVTGRRPFSSHAIFDLLRQVVDEPAPIASSINPKLPSQLDAVLAKGLSKKPADRFDSARALTKALLPFASNDARVLWARATPAPSEHENTSVKELQETKAVPLGRSGAKPLDESASKDIPDTAKRSQPTTRVSETAATLAESRGDTNSSAETRITQLPPPLAKRWWIAAVVLLVAFATIAGVMVVSRTPSAGGHGTSPLSDASTAAVHTDDARVTASATLVADAEAIDSATASDAASAVTIEDASARQTTPSRPDATSVVDSGRRRTGGNGHRTGYQIY